MFAAARGAPGDLPDAFRIDVTADEIKEVHMAGAVCAMRTLNAQEQQQMVEEFDTRERKYQVALFLTSLIAGISLVAYSFKSC